MARPDTPRTSNELPPIFANVLGTSPKRPRVGLFAGLNNTPTLPRSAQPIGIVLLRYVEMTVRLVCSHFYKVVIAIFDSP